MLRIAFSFFLFRSFLLLGVLLSGASSLSAAVLREVEFSLFDSTRTILLFDHLDLSTFTMTGTLAPGSYVLAYTTAVTADTEMGETAHGSLAGSARFVLGSTPETSENSSAFLAADVTDGAAPYVSDSGVPSFNHAISDQSSAGSSAASANSQYRLQNGLPISLSLSTNLSANSVTPADSEWAESRSQFGIVWEFDLATSATFSVSSSTGVPEPAAGLLLVCALAIGAAGRRKRTAAR